MLPARKPHSAIRRYRRCLSRTRARHTLTQNARGLPERSRDAYGATAVHDDSLDFDQNGNVAAISDGLPLHRGDRTMTYDGLDRLTDVISPMYGAAGAHYSYDALDNLKTVIAPGRDHHYCYDASNRLTSVRTGSCGGAIAIALSYDVQGNLASKNGTLFDFDFGNRLRSVSGGGTYVYDGLGRRVRDNVVGPGGTKYSQYSQAGQLVFANDKRRQTWLDYVYLGGSLVAVRERDNATGVYTAKYQHTDALGTPVAVTNASRTVIERMEYEPYGKGLFGGPGTTVPKDGPGYTGHVLDAATGMNYMQQRYYDPGIGRFLSRDPVTADPNTGANFNAYWYANNNPYAFTDPDGRQSRREAYEQRQRENFCNMGCAFGSFAPDTANGRYSSGAIYPSREAASEAASQHQTDLAGGTWQKYLFGSGHLTFLYEGGDAFGYSLVLYQGGIAPAFGGVGGVSNSRLLSRSLRGAGFIRPVGSAAHHIVAGNARGGAAARAVLQRFGISINEASNGVYLPAAAHHSLHTNAYYNAVNSALGQATTRQEALQALQTIRKGLASGAFP